MNYGKQFKLHWIGVIVFVIHKRSAGPWLPRCAVDLAWRVAWHLWRRLSTARCCLDSIKYILLIITCCVCVCVLPESLTSRRAVLLTGARNVTAGTSARNDNDNNDNSRARCSVSHRSPAAGARNVTTGTSLHAVSLRTAVGVSQGRRSCRMS